MQIHPVSFAIFAPLMNDEEFNAELDGFIAHCTKGMRLFDIGASFGFFCLAALHYGGPETRVVAVDPSHLSNRIHRHNLRLARAGERAQVIEAAVGAEDGTLPMLTTGPAGDHYLVVSANRPDVTNVRQFSIESLIVQTSMEPSHLKIDVEGFEGEVIEGAVEFLRRRRPVVFLELHGNMLRERGRDPLAVLRRLAGCGYTQFRRSGKAIDMEDAATLSIVRLVCLPHNANGLSN